MKTRRNILWLLILVAVAATVTELSFLPPVPEVSAKTAVKRSPNALHIHGMSLGVKNYEISLKYKVLEKQDGWETFGYEKVDPITGEPRFFLAARYDWLGKSVYLKGDGIAWDFEALTWEELTTRADLLGEPRVVVKRETSKFREVHEIYDKVGLLVVKVNDTPVEFHLFSE